MKGTIKYHYKGEGTQEMPISWQEQQEGAGIADRMRGFQQVCGISTSLLERENSIGKDSELMHEKKLQDGLG